MSDLVRFRLLEKAANMLPKTWPALLKIIGFQETDFELYVVCPECSTVYELQHVILRTRTGFKSSNVNMHASQDIARHICEKAAESSS